MNFTPEDRALAERVLQGIEHDLVKRLADASPTNPVELTSAAAFLAVRASHGTVEVDFENLLQRCIDALPDNRRPDLWGGVPGVGWMLQFAAEEMGVEDQLISSVDEFVELALDQDAYSPFDLISGVAAGVIYLLARPRTPENERRLRKLLDALHARSVKNDVGVVWTVPKEHPAVNLGVAHGIPGAIIALARVLELGVGAPRDRELLEGTLRSLLHFRVPGERYEYPYRTDRPGGRVGWCYGDLGVASSLLQAAKVLKHDEARRLGIEAGARMAAVAFKDTFSNDSGLCHGDVGNALVFRDLAFRTADSRFSEAAVSWVRVCLKRFDPAKPLHGYRAIFGEQLLEDYSVLTGIAGIGLGLESLLSGERAPWEQLLGLFPGELSGAS